MSHDNGYDLPQVQSAHSTPKTSRQIIRQRIEVGVGVILFFLGTGIQLLWPDQKWLGLAFTIAGGAGLLLIGIWALALHVARKQVQASLVAPAAATPEVTQQQRVPISNTNTFEPNFAPVINVHQAQLQTQEQAPTVTAPVSVPPDIECIDCYFTKTTISVHNRLNEVGMTCMAAQADFYLKPMPGADPWIELRTHLEFYGPNNKRLQRVSDGMWKEQENIAQLPMRTGDTRRLVIAVEFDDVGFSTYEYAQQATDRRRYTTTGVFTYFVAPKVTPLNEDTLTVKVNLVGKYNEEVTLNRDFWFSLTRPDMTIKQIPVPHFDSDSASSLGGLA